MGSRRWRCATARRSERARRSPATSPRRCRARSSSPGQLNVETTRFPDGRAELSLVVTDAAGNTTVVTSPPLVIDNNGPAAPASLTASAVGAGSDVVNLAWSDPANPPEPVTGAFAQLCQASCAPAIAVSPAGAAQITAPGPGSYTVRLWLVDSAGKGGPQNAATTAVTVPASKPGRKRRARRQTAPAAHRRASPRRSTERDCRCTCG